MIALLRLAAIVIAIEAVFYVLLSIYLRSLERERLEEAWDAANPGRGGDSPARRAFIERRMAAFHKTLRARLVALVLVLPFVAIMVIVYFVNYD